uniref:Uncharacterized protein LOC113785178 n=1 Tax=Cicer arietinum TaxID=3827 RepID=A0A3Q7Y7T6_CICAR|nr:uncharacterized protein LOC113785178 [Cicer arietinum]
MLTDMDKPLLLMDKTYVDTTNVFDTYQIFDTRDAVVNWAKEIGLKNKVTIIIRRLYIETGEKERRNKLILGCGKGGKYKYAASSTRNSKKKCDCHFKLRSKPLKDGSGWTIKVICGIHNYESPDTLEGHAFVRCLDEEERKHVHDLTKYNVALRHILLSLQDRNKSNVTKISQIYKQMSMIRLHVRGNRTEMQHLFKLIEDAKYVCWNRKRENSDFMRDIFWAHPDSVKLLNLFPIMLIMDITYKTNKYVM